MPASATEFEYVKGRILEFSSKIVEISKGAEPAYSNAANGYFRDHLVDDPVMKGVARDAEKPLTEDAKLIFDTYKQFAADVYGGFTQNANNKSDPIQNPRLLGEIKEIIADVVRIAGELVTLYIGDPASKSAAVAALKQDIESLLTDIKNKKAQLEGENANGHIAEAVNKAAVQAASTIGGHPWGPDGKKLADTLAGAASEVGKLDTTGHDPWLRPEWQVRFEGIMSALTLTLS